MSQNEDIFSNLPIIWKILIIIGLITLFIIFILIIVLVYLFSDKTEMEADIKDYDNFLDEFENSKDVEDIDKNVDQSIPKNNDLNGNLLKDLLQIKITN
jgi:cbb3-type cytochrome oxidase subunit 3